MKKIILPLALILTLLVVCCKPKTPAASSGPQVVAAAEVQKMITAKIFIKPGMEKDFAEAAKWIIENTLKEPGCIQYTLFQDPYNPSNFFFFERYRNQAAIDAHFAATYFKEFGTKIGDLTSQPAEIKIWDISENMQNN